MIKDNCKPAHLRIWENWNNSELQLDQKHEHASILQLFWLPSLLRSRSIKQFTRSAVNLTDELYIWPTYEDELSRAYRFRSHVQIHCYLSYAIFIVSLLKLRTLPLHDHFIVFTKHFPNFSWSSNFITI